MKSNVSYESAAQAIVNRFAELGFKIELEKIVAGDTVTRYLFSYLSENLNMHRIQSFSDDIRVCLDKNNIMLYESSDGKNVFAVEVAGDERRLADLKELLDSPEFKNANGKLSFIMGRDVEGNVIVADLAQMPHLLIGGTTGSGKSIFINGIIASLMAKYPPEYLRFIIVDPRGVEMSRYNGSPYLLTTDVVTESADTLAAMDYLVSEMERRYETFCQCGARSIADYNEKAAENSVQKLPYLVLMVDELAYIAADNKKAFENKLIRLAQKSRASGIHVVLATQRPTVDVISGTIKANMPCRVAFKVFSPYDSRAILDDKGAENLIGRGDMLFSDPSKLGFTRIQGAYVCEEDLCSFVKRSIEEKGVYYDPSVCEAVFVTNKSVKKEAPVKNFGSASDVKQAEKSNGWAADDLEPYYKKALKYWLERNGGKASISSLQRGLMVGFNRAGRIMEELQKMGYVETLSNDSGINKQLNVLVSLDDLDKLFPDVD